ncbi:MAG: hypothetical protein II943_05580 [Victivallales bacterium]|nr:hypothetical protein [Victivallales bacterium]
MSGFSWILLNIVLIVGAIYGTMKVRSAPPPKPLQLEEAVAANSQDAVQHKNAPRGADKNSGTPTAPSRALSTNASLDALWKQTLFLPTRTEDTGEDAAEQAAAEQAAFAANNIEFELVGIAQISTVDTSDPVPVAILRSKVGAASGQRGRRPPARGGADATTARRLRPSPPRMKNGRSSAWATRSTRPGTSLRTSMPMQTWSRSPAMAKP